MFETVYPINNRSIIITAIELPSFPMFLHYFVALFTLLVSVLSIIGNILTICILQSQKHYSQPIKCYRIQLAISHIISPVATYWMLTASSLKGVWLFGEYGCIFYGFVQGVCAFFSILVVAAIAFNRAIRLTAVTPSTSTKAVRNSVLLWIASLALSAPPIFGWNRFKIEGLGTSCCFNLHPVDIASRAYVIFILAFGFIGPLAIIFCSYQRVCSVLFKSALFRKRSKFSVEVERKESSPINQLVAITLSSASVPYSQNLSVSAKLLVIWRDRQNFQHIIRPLRTMFFVIVCFVCAWLPYATLAVVGQFASFGKVGPYVNIAAALIAKSYIAINPVVYVLTDESFRKRLLDILSRWGVVKSQTTSYV